MASERTLLERQLVARIQREGAMTFRDFMQAALYDPEQGYYNTERLKIGPAGDYYTSSNVHSAFGAVLARAFVELLNETGGVPDPLTIVEAGAGTGQLALDVLKAMRDEHCAIFEKLSYVIVETSPAMRALQRQRSIGLAGRLQWRELAELIETPVTGIIFSNEMIDALPVHRVRCRRGRIEELYVTTPLVAGLKEPGADDLPAAPDAGEASLAFAWREPSTPRLAEYLARSEVTLAQGQVAEVNLDALDWMARASSALARGFLVTIDYGDVAGHLYGPDRREGTLRAFYKHALIDSVLERVGEQDITANVNFTALIEYGRDCGLETVSYERQAAFLIRNGLIDRIAAMENEGSGTLKERLAVKNLFVPGGVSDNFRVLVQRKIN